MMLQSEKEPMRSLHLIMGVIFFFVVTPIAIIMRILKKDLLNLKLNNNETYWIKKSKYKSKMKNQF